MSGLNGKSVLIVAALADTEERTTEDRLNNLAAHARLVGSRGNGSREARDAHAHS